MGWSYGKNGILKINGKYSKYPESGGEKEAKKTKIAMGDCIKRSRKNGRMEKKEQQIEGIGES